MTHDQKALKDVLSQMRDKAKLERSLLPRIRAQLDKIATSFRQSFASSGMLPNLNAHKERIARLLAEHYRATGKLFSDVVIAQFGITPEGAEELRDLAFAQWIEDRAPLQSFAIVTTSERRMPRTLAEATQVLVAEEKPATNAAIATVAANLLRRHGRQRASSIASFETQVGAETMKRIEADAISGRVPFSLPRAGFVSPIVVDPIAVATKQWQTEQDDNVRQAHVAANLQAVPFDRPFVVGGERLNFPGDTSFGAGLANVIGCRCAAIYSTGG